MPFWDDVGSFFEDVGTSIGDGFVDMGEGIVSGAMSVGAITAAGIEEIQGNHEQAARLVKDAENYGDDFIHKAPVVSDVTDIVDGIIEGDPVKALIGAAGLAVNVVTLGEGTAITAPAKVIGKSVAKSVAKTITKSVAKTVVKSTAKTTAKTAAKSTAKAVAKTTVKEIAETASKQAGKQAVKQTAKQTAKQTIKSTAKEAVTTVVEQAALVTTEKILAQEEKEWEQKVENEMEKFDDDLDQLYAVIGELEMLIASNIKMSMVIKQLNSVFCHPKSSIVIIAKQIAVDTESEASMMKIKFPEKSFGLQVTRVGLQSLMMVTTFSKLTGLASKVLKKLKGRSKLTKIGKGIKHAAFVGQIAVMTIESKNQIDFLKSQYNEISEMREKINSKQKEIEFGINEIKNSYKKYVDKLTEIFPDKKFNCDNWDALKKQLEILVDELCKFETDFYQVRAVITAVKDFDEYNGEFIDYDSISGILSPNIIQFDVYFATICSEWFGEIKVNPKLADDKSTWIKMSDQFKLQNTLISTDDLKLFYKKWLKINTNNLFKKTNIEEKSNDDHDINDYIGSYKCSENNFYSGDRIRIAGDKKWYRNKIMYGFVETVDNYFSLTRNVKDANNHIIYDGSNKQGLLKIRREKDKKEWLLNKCLDIHDYTGNWRCKDNNFYSGGIITIANVKKWYRNGEHYGFVETVDGEFSLRRNVKDANDHIIYGGGNTEGVLKVRRASDKHEWVLENISIL